MKYRFDCFYFKGYKPCEHKKLCENCDLYKPIEKKILIIKLGALGDVLRTTPVLHAFRRKYPGAHITWVTKSNAKDMLSTTKNIQRILSVEDLDHGSLMRLQVEEFDELHCYDKEDAAIGLATLCKAKKKFGFYMNSHGHMAPINEASEYSFDLGLSDDLKFNKNQKTYQELTYESSELPVPSPMDNYEMPLLEKDFIKAKKYFQTLGWNGSTKIVGLNTGSGRVFQTKQWLEEYFIELAKRLHDSENAKVLLLGGKDEHERNLRIEKALDGKAFYPGCDFSIREFAAVLKSCKVLVTGDTLAMHLALTVGTRVVVLFGSTCEQEVDVYGLGEKIVSKPSCAPCYRDQCPQADYMRCMKDITPSKVYEVVTKQLPFASAHA